MIPYNALENINKETSRKTTKKTTMKTLRRTSKKEDLVRCQCMLIYIVPYEVYRCKNKREVEINVPYFKKAVIK
ncbi:hypothetical protein ACN38_g12321 [Penicillium nordicum]|uniref:Uncharacterized protein n=1 Tax=Penicillium nordicum TaxID=229535 RepID=A0A0M8NYF6_9EURO|nr:hypothetical protein ACN38_g12321 [Penicillium nordicum]